MIFRKLLLPLLFVSTLLFATDKSPTERIAEYLSAKCGFNIASLGGAKLSSLLNFLPSVDLASAQRTLQTMGFDKTKLLEIANEAGVAVNDVAMYFGLPSIPALEEKPVEPQSVTTGFSSVVPTELIKGRSIAIVSPGVNLPRIKIDVSRSLRPWDRQWYLSIELTQIDAPPPDIIVYLKNGAANAGSYFLTSHEPLQVHFKSVTAIHFQYKDHGTIVLQLTESNQ